MSVSTALMNQSQQSQSHAHQTPPQTPQQQQLMALSQQQQQHLQALNEKADSSSKTNPGGLYNTVRLVPSGKVYRQLFEAQVNLEKSTQMFFFFSKINQTYHRKGAIE